MLEALHFLHLASGIAWAGGALFFAFVVGPGLATLGGPAMKPYLQVQARFAGPFMAGSGIVLLVTGMARAFAGGGVSAPADLFTTAYGRWVLAALAIVILVTVLGGAQRAGLARMLAAGEIDDAALRASQWRNALVTGTGILVTIAIMTILGMGFY